MSRWEGWKLIGHVGVDSGQLMLVDPCYIDGEWQTNQQFEDIRRYEDSRGRVFQFGKDFDHFEEALEQFDLMTPNELIRTKAWKEIPYRSTSEAFGYNTVSHKTIDEQTAQLNYKLGHPGLAVAFRSGWGDGCYPVYAQIEGGRVARVAVEMFDDEEGEVDAEADGRS